MTSIATGTPSAHYDTHRDAVVIDSLSITDPVVATESRRWSTGRRGPVLAPADMQTADLTAFVTQAITIGVHAIASAGGVQDQVRLQTLVAQVGDRTAEASSNAATVTTETSLWRSHLRLRRWSGPRRRRRRPSRMPECLPGRASRKTSRVLASPWSTRLAACSAARTRSCSASWRRCWTGSAGSSTTGPRSRPPT